MTTLTEANFTRADNIDISGSLSWVDHLTSAAPGGGGGAAVDSWRLVSDRAKILYTDGSYYCFSTAGALATENHSAQCTIATAGEAGNLNPGYGDVGPCVRIDATTGACYNAVFTHYDDSVNITKVGATGGRTTLNTVAVSAPGSPPYGKVLKLTVTTVGGNAHLVANYDGVNVLSYDDSISPILGNVNVGIGGYSLAGTLVPTITAFSATDVAVGGAATLETLTGPSGGQTGVASSPITLGADGDISGVITTFTTTGTGTFAPPTLTGAGTTAYTPGVDETAQLNCTNDGGLTPPADLPYTSAAVAPCPTIGEIRAEVDAAIANLPTSVEVALLISDGIANLATKRNAGVIFEGVIIGSPTPTTTVFKLSGSTTLAQDELHDMEAMIVNAGHPFAARGQILGNSTAAGAVVTMKSALPWAPIAGDAIQIIGTLEGSDPLAVAVPGSYGSGQAGKVLGDIVAKTNALPADPASASGIAGLIAAVNTMVAFEKAFMVNWEFTNITATGANLHVWPVGTIHTIGVGELAIVPVIRADANSPWTRSTL